MELNLSELDNINTMNPYETFNNNLYQEQNNNYWEKPKVDSKKKKVSFNDILSNMNLVVNKQGILQFMTQNSQQEEQYQQQYQQQYDSNDFSQRVQNKNIKIVQNPQKNTISEQIDPTVKHSYIYNKYFKDYADPNAEKPGPRVPKTIEEYYQMLIDDKKRAIEHKQRIEQIKSKKLLFTTTPGIGNNPRNIQATKNNLRRMNFG